MNAPGPRRCQTDTQLPRKLRVAARHKSRRLLVTHLDETNLVLTYAQRFHDAVDAVSRETKDNVNTPIHQRFDEHIRRIHQYNPLLYEKSSLLYFYGATH